MKNLSPKDHAEAVALFRSEIVGALHVAKDDPGDVRDRALSCLGFASGCRRSELVALDIGDLNFARVLQRGGGSSPCMSRYRQLCPRTLANGASVSPARRCDGLFGG